MFFPRYTGTSTPGWSATDPTPAVFTSYAGSLDNVAPFLIPAGLLYLDYDEGVGVSASITAATPEGSSLAFMLIGSAAIGMWMAMGRRSASSRFSSLA